VYIDIQQDFRVTIALDREDILLISVRSDFIHTKDLKNLVFLLQVDMIYVTFNGNKVKTLVILMMKKNDHDKHNFKDLHTNK